MEQPLLKLRRKYFKMALSNVGILEGTKEKIFSKQLQIMLVCSALVLKFKTHHYGHPWFYPSTVKRVIGPNSPIYLDKGHPEESKTF